MIIYIYTVIVGKLSHINKIMFQWDISPRNSFLRPHSPISKAGSAMARKKWFPMHAAAMVQMCSKPQKKHRESNRLILWFKLLVSCHYWSLLRILPYSSGFAVDPFQIAQVRLPQLLKTPFPPAHSGTSWRAPASHYGRCPSAASFWLHMWLVAIQSLTFWDFF